MKKIRLFTLLLITLTFAAPLTAHAHEVGPGVMWVTENGVTKYKNEAGDGFVSNKWIKEAGKWYYFGHNCAMATGWRVVDGKYYYLTENADSDHPLGSLWVDCTTPDGYTVDADGAIIGDTAGLNPFGYTCVEVNLTTQTVTLYDRLTPVASAPCVTGRATKERATTPGHHAIYSMETERYLRGTNEDGTKYKSYVHYWMPFYKGQGLHDATWRKKFGGTIYKQSGSHGCVNLPLDFAALLFSRAYVGMPVEVHE